MISLDSHQYLSFLDWFDTVGLVTYGAVLVTNTETRTKLIALHSVKLKLRKKIALVTGMVSSLQTVCSSCALLFQLGIERVQACTC